MNMYHILAAEGNEASELSRIAIESESYWGYDSDFMNKFKVMYQVTEEFIRKNPTFILYENDKIIGFYALSIKPEENTIEYFYIETQYIGKGYGEKMWTHLANYCKGHNIKDFTLVTSPEAKAFYEKMGAVHIGEVESTLKKGRKIPKLKCTLADVYIHMNIKETLKQAYNNHAHERKDEIQEWKVGPRNKFMSLLEEEGKRTLLEIGAGNGRDSRFFIDNGFQVVATDLSDEMVKICKAKDIEAYEIDYYNLSHMNKTFDAIWAMNCLLHVKKADLEIVLKEIDKVLSPSGLFFMGIYGGEDKEGIWEEDIYTPHRFFSFYSDNKIRDIVVKYFDLVSFDRIQTGGKHYHQSIILRKKG
jgi:SAM-dependent methyltransferase/ribosomal protein S18 acetylase RimI-like enzyme